MRDGRLIAGREPATDGARCLYRRPDGTHYLLGASGGAELGRRLDLVDAYVLSLGTSRQRLAYRIRRLSARLKLTHHP
jgi:hypothetical protein